MAGRRRPPAPVIPTTALVASAARYAGATARIYAPSQQWQTDCYRHYSICGEARFAANYFGNSLSKVTLFAGEMTEEGIVRLKDTSDGALQLKALFNGADGQKQMLQAIGVHLTVAGECFLVGRSATGDPQRDRGNAVGADIWEIVSVLEMKVTGKKWTIKYGDGLPDVELTDEDVVIRIWRPHPARRIEADSPFRSLLPILAEIEWLTLHIFAQTRSRLAGAGLLFLPQGMTFPPPPDVDGKPQVAANEADAFMLMLADAMMRPIDDPSSPSAVVPPVIIAPDDVIDKARLMHFWSDLDAASLEMRSASIHRFALGMDMPPEKVLGMSSNGGSGGGTSNGVSHWGAWQIDEDTIKLHVEPMADLVVNAVAVGYLRVATGGDEVVGYDSSGLRLRPDRSKEAMELWDRGALKTEVMLRENGFDVNDIPDDIEKKEWFLRKIAGGSATPEQVGAALKELGIDLGVDVGAIARDTRPVPSLEQHPTKQMPDRAAALFAASEALVFRALERAGNRLRQNVGKPPNCPSYEVHTLVLANGTAAAVLEDAFSCAPQVLDGLADPEKVVPVLEAYCMSLMAEQSPHTRERLTKWLARA